MDVNNNVVGHRGHDFSEGLSRILSSMCVNMSKAVYRVTMAHLIVSNEGSRFQFSHKLMYLLVSQMHDKLDDKEVNCCIRTNYSMLQKHKVMWPDSSADDYLYRPNESENMCLYEYVSKFKKVCKKFKEIKSENKTASTPDEAQSVDEYDEDCDNASEEEEGGNMGPNRYYFHEDYPGYEFLYFQATNLR